MVTTINKILLLLLLLISGACCTVYFASSWQNANFSSALSGSVSKIVSDFPEISSENIQAVKLETGAVNPSDEENGKEKENLKFAVLPQVSLLGKPQLEELLFQVKEQGAEFAIFSGDAFDFSVPEKQASTDLIVFKQTVEKYFSRCYYVFGPDEASAGGDYLNRWKEVFFPSEAAAGTEKLLYHYFGAKGSGFYLLSSGPDKERIWTEGLDLLEKDIGRTRDGINVVVMPSGSYGKDGILGCLAEEARCAESEKMLENILGKSAQTLLLIGGQNRIKLSRSGKIATEKTQAEEHPLLISLGADVFEIKTLDLQGKILKINNFNLTNSL